MYEQHSLHRSTPELSFESGLRIPSPPSSLPLIVSLRSQLLFSPSIHREKKSCRYSKQNMSHAFPSLRTIGLQRTTSQSIGSEQEDNTVSQNFTVDDDVRFASRAPAETTRTPSDFSIILSLVRPYTHAHAHLYSPPYQQQTLFDDSPVHVLFGSVVDSVDRCTSHSHRLST